MAGALTTFGAHCRELRIAQDRTMGDQAKALDCAVHYISAIETGKVSPNADYLERLRQWLKLDDRQFSTLTRRTKSSVVTFKPRFSTSNNSTSMRLFRKISKLDPIQIRQFRKRIEVETDK